MPSVLFVCQGNLYRSVAAAAIFTEKLRRSQLDWQQWRVESAGTWARENLPTTPEMMEVMAKRGLDVKKHRSRMVSAEILAGFALILTMESGQKEALQIEFPFAARRIYLLTEMAGAKVQIDDPFDTSAMGLQILSNQIDDWLERGFQHILELGRAPEVNASFSEKKI
jgi:protein-tyrosine-phosphatase